jgi:hypothetical protein
MNKSNWKALVSRTPSRWLGRELSTAIVLVHEAVASRLGLSATDWTCWGPLDQHGPCTAGRLAELSGFPTGAITGIVEGLERAGYAGRRRQPSDRPRVIIHPLRVQRLLRVVCPIFASLTATMDPTLHSLHIQGTRRGPRLFTTDRRGHARADRKALQHPPIGGASGVSRTWIFVVSRCTRRG